MTQFPKNYSQTTCVSFEIKKPETEGKSPSDYEQVKIQDTNIGEIIIALLDQGNMLVDKEKKSKKSFDFYAVSELDKYLLLSHISNLYEEDETTFSRDLGLCGGGSYNYNIDFEIVKKGNALPFWERIKRNKYPNRYYGAENNYLDDAAIIRNTKYTHSGIIFGLRQNIRKISSFSGRNWYNLYLSEPIERFGSMVENLPFETNNFYKGKSFEEFLLEPIKKDEILNQKFTNAIEQAKKE